MKRQNPIHIEFLIVVTESKHKDRRRSWLAIDLLRARKIEEERELSETWTRECELQKQEGEQCLPN